MSVFVFAAKTEDVKEGEILPLILQETRIALTRINGEVRAFGDICTHDDGPLSEGYIEDRCVVCPRHGAKFDLETGKPTFPAVTPIPIYPVTIKGNEIWVGLPETVS
ncbi:MAG: non-heme iron oxygenase ferredoxin subunit [Thermoflexales bacterium]|nr:non-heme iron oxygenase ferredoxin subunit [Thermoflexales bacterium]MCS7325063.1 non-heme iron oxygenase ferredoxin subunit [Thermoflexales bacterium]MCX7939034.1 non-heme iron oxygenase ferredoxin subunit [Thermoflexales bacterium]MDW8054152.1 non-heme iron oxygenase ferredoxin subunit [Anaerolineae bacterium]MDW8292328.1 non-heme iron oxygenase ferredoxin subunit [Anaerolineae bacterium]